MAMRHFVAVADRGSFSRAALEHGVKVSTVSRHVAALEADVQAALFNRSTRRLHLTEAGALFLGRARAVLADLDQARQTTRDWNGRPQGVLKVAMPGAFGRLVVMPAMGAFLKAFPDVRLEATLTETPPDPIAAGLDAVLRIGVLEDSTLVARRLAHAPSLIVARPDLVGAGADLHLPDMLHDLPCLGATTQGTERWWWHCSDGRHGHVAIDSVLRTNDVEALRAAACAGLGVALLPCWLVTSDLAAGRLVQLFDDRRWGFSVEPEPGIWLLYPPKKTVSPKLRAFVSFLSTRFGHA
ncbi:LysR family transcriptional regulator [Neoasaia chiangmaiensis]|nr:LysR family transcriptional regulator [Neoasaia chiangmaiensis]